MSTAANQPASYRAAPSSSSHDMMISVEDIQRLWVLRSISRTLLAPMDRVKFIVQCQRELQRFGTLPGEFKSTMSCVRHLYQLEGARSFWRGNLMQVGSLLPIVLAQYLIAIPTQTFIFDVWPSTSALGYTAVSFVAPLGGALAAAMITYPLEFARFRLAVDVKAYKGAPYEFRHSLGFFSQPIMNECPHFLYKGLMLYVFGSLVYSAVHSVLVNIVAPYIPPTRNGGGWRPVAVQSVCGLTIAASATMCLHPVDLVRHRMMIAVTEDKYRYPSAMHCVRRIMQQEGLRGFYRGAGITLMRMMAATGLVMVGLPY